MSIAMRFEIRASDRDDIERITRSSGFFSETEVAIALDVFDEAIGNNPSGYRYVVAAVGDRVAGYACWGKDTQTLASYELYWIAVDATCRSQGIGRQLLDTVENAVRQAGGGRLFAETSGRAQYRPTRAFYVRCGYDSVARIDDYFGPGDARVIYAKAV